MSDTGDSATKARLWIEANVALFVVIVIAAVLLVVALITLAIYCCCCRKKKGRWSRGRGDSKSTGSHLQIDLHGDSVDADSAVTATIRGTGAIEIQLEKEHHQYQQQQQQQQPESGPGYPEFDLPQSSQVVSVTPEILITHEEGVSLDEVRFQQQAEFPPLPPLPQGVEVTPEAELLMHVRPLPELKAEVAEEAAKPMRLPRTEVVLRTESPSWQIQQQQLLQLRASPPTFRTEPPQAAVVVTAEAAAPTVVRIGRPPSHEHRHGSSIYQSDDNEITIVDSDFSDYEDSAEDEARKRLKKRRQLGAGVVAADFGWETLPNQSVVQLPASPPEEPPIVAIDRHGVEYVPAPSPALEEQRARREENLAELDRTLDVFEQQGQIEASIGVEIGSGQMEVRLDAVDGYVDEEEIQAIDRTQMIH